MKRILSLLVAMIMTLGCVGISAMAETVNTLDELLNAIENGDGNITLGADIDLNGNSYVAKIGKQGYETVEAAINAAQNGDTVTICAGEYGAINISNKNITIQGTVGDNGELLTTIKDGNPAITGHSFNGTIKDIRIVDAWKVMYAEPAGNVTVDNVYVTGATYGFHLVAYSPDLTWKIENSYMDLRWANSFGVNGAGDADIIIRGNEFAATNPYYEGGDVYPVNSYLPSVTVEENIFGENTRISIENVTDTSKINISKNYHADGVENAFDSGSVTVPIKSYYTDVDADGNLTGLVTITDDVAEVNGVGYETLEAAFKAATDGCTIDILDDVVIDYKWDCRDYATNGSHSQFKESVTINGNNHTIKFTGTISDGNWNTIFRFEENAIVKDLTIDISEATGTQRVITAKKSLDVDNLTIVGSAIYGIIFGEGASAEDLSNAEISIANSNLNGTRRAISDNEGGKDVKSVTVTGNTLNANVYLSASESITFNNNTATGEVDLRAYTKGNTLDVTATGNTLNTEKKNYIGACGTINAQPEFYIPAKGSNSPAYTGEVNGYVRVWGQSENTNASKSFELKLYSNDTLIATTQLNNVDNIIDGSQDSITWTFFYPESNDAYWTTTWEEGHPNALDKPTKVELYIDGTLVSTTAAQMNGPDNLHPVIWEDLGGVKAPELPTATVTELSEEELGENAPELTFALNFKADEVTKEQLDYYGDWFADYVLTINKDFTANANGSADGYLAGQYDTYSKNWVSVPFEDVTLEAGTKLRVLKYALEGKLTDYKTPLTYKDVYNLVKEFNCGIYFDEDYIAANPDLEVTLELRMYHPDESKNKTYVIGRTYEFAASDIATPVASIGTKKYSSLDAAIAAANAGETVTLLENIELTETVTVPAGKTITLDLNGKTITGTDNNTSGNFYLISVNKGNLTVDDSVGDGKITLTATNERNWNSSSVVIANNQGTLTVNGGAIEHLGGTSMAYGIDTLTNGNIGAATTTISGGSVDSTYFAVRQFANSATTMNTVVITGGVVGYVWMQSPNNNVNTATTTISGGMVDGLCVSGVNADYTLSALVSAVGEVYGTMPTGKELTETNGTYSLTDEIEEVEKFKLYSMNIDLEGALVANFYVDPKNLSGEDYYAKIVHSSQKGDIEEIIEFAQWTDNNGFKCFSYSGLVAKNMADKITVTIFNKNDVAVSESAETSLSKYALNYITANAGENMTAYQSAWVKAYVDMLNYGAEAQKHFSYNASNLANANLGDYKKYATKEDVTLESNAVVSGPVAYANVDLEDRIVYNAYFTGVTENMHAEVSFTNHLNKLVTETIPYEGFVMNNGFYQLSVKSLVVADANQQITIVVKDSTGKVHASVTDSINGYLARAIPSQEKFATLGNAMAKFTASVYEALHVND